MVCQLLLLVYMREAQWSEVGLLHAGYQDSLALLPLLRYWVRTL